MREEQRATGKQLSSFTILLVSMAQLQTSLKAEKTTPKYNQKKVTKRP